MTTSRNPRFTYAVGVDPGSSTGLAIVRGDGVALVQEQGSPVILDDFMDRFPFLYHVSADVLIACERFVTTVETAKRSSQPVAQQVVGVVDRIARLSNWKLHLQAPADAKQLVPNELLRQLGLLRTGRDVGRPDADDVNDASRHAVTLLAQRRATMFDELLRGTTL